MDDHWALAHELLCSGVWTTVVSHIENAEWSWTQCMFSQKLFLARCPIHNMFPVGVETQIELVECCGLCFWGKECACNTLPSILHGRPPFETPTGMVKSCDLFWLTHLGALHLSCDPSLWKPCGEVIYKYNVQVCCLLIGIYWFLLAKELVFFITNEDKTLF
jgi:hypothetical protein